MWVYNDAFVVTVSTALALRFNQINERLKMNARKPVSRQFWREVREDYVRLAELCGLVDGCLSLNVLVSYQINLFFILERLYYTFELVLEPLSTW